MKAIVVEDSRLAREGLIRMLAKYPKIELIGQAENVLSAKELIEQDRPELVFLDIHMPGGSGFELLEQLDYLPKIIFTTAYADYAIRSFDFNTVDYLLKPIAQTRLDAAIAKLFDSEDEGKAQQNETNSESDAGEKTPAALPRLEIDSKIFIKDGDKCHLIDLKAIRYIESCKNYVQIFFGNQHAYIKKSMQSIEERLPPSMFFRASRQHIVNLREISRIEESIRDGYMVAMSDGKVLEISRRQAAELKDLLSL
jgi:two-component system LytT family response regulator